MNALDVLCAQLTRDLFAIAKFLLAIGWLLLHGCCSFGRPVTIGTPMVLSVFDDWYSVPFVKNSQKMTIGVPIVTCLHRVRRIHKAAQTPLPCETCITCAWAVATACRPWADDLLVENVFAVLLTSVSFEAFALSVRGNLRYKSWSQKLESLAYPTVNPTVISFDALLAQLSATKSCYRWLCWGACCQDAV